MNSFYHDYSLFETHTLVSSSFGLTRNKARRSITLPIIKKGKQVWCLVTFCLILNKSPITELINSLLNTPSDIPSFLASPYVNIISPLFAITHLTRFPFFFSQLVSLSSSSTVLSTHPEISQSNLTKPLKWATSCL